MKNTFLLREEFKVWLTTIGQFPLPSAKSYLSYVAGADKTFIISSDIIEGETNLFELLKVHVESGDTFGMDNAIINIINELYEKNIDKKLNTPISTIGKWRSALFQYREFLYDYIETKIDTIEEENKITEENNVIENFEDFNLIETSSEDSETIIVGLEEMSDFVYSKNDLYKNFRFRIITQDRFYNQIFYPIRFIKRFLYSRGEKQFIDQWVENLLDNIEVHLDNHKIKLKEITELSISNRKVFVKHDGISKQVFTKLSDNIKLAPFNVKQLSKIAIDHEKPLFHIMLENMENLKTFDEITVELKKHLSGTVNPKKLKLAYNIVLNSDIINHLNIENLKKELDFLSSKTNLQLMDSGENGSKNKNQ